MKTKEQKHCCIHVIVVGSNIVNFKLDELGNKIKLEKLITEVSASMRVEDNLCILNVSMFIFKRYEIDYLNIYIYKQIVHVFLFHVNIYNNNLYIVCVI